MLDIFANRIIFRAKLTKGEGYVLVKQPPVIANMGQIVLSLPIPNLGVCRSVPLNAITCIVGEDGLLFG